MRIAICDDEKEIRDVLYKKVQSLCPDAQILLYGSGEELLLPDARADICLLDIQMSGKDGMETAREFRKCNKKAILIFVTAMEEYVFDAFDVGAFHYLVKPFDDAKFKEVIEGAVEQYQEAFSGVKNDNSVGNNVGNAIRNNTEDVRNADNADNLDIADNTQKYIVVHSNGSHIKVRLEDIVFAEVFNRIVIIHKLDEDIKYYGKLSELVKAAGEEFFRPHRAYLINFKYVERYDSSTIYMEKGQALIAKKNYSEFVKRYLRYIKGCNRRNI